MPAQYVEYAFVEAIESIVQKRMPEDLRLRMKGILQDSDAVEELGEELQD